MISSLAQRVSRSRFPIGRQVGCVVRIDWRGYQSVHWDDDGVAHSLFTIDEQVAKDQRFTEFVTRKFGQFPDKLAIVDGVTNSKRTFGDLLDDINSVGWGLKEQYGLKPGSTMGIMTVNHVDFFSCLHGAAKLGATITPINPSYTQNEVGEQLISSSATSLIAHPDCLDTAKKAAAYKLDKTGVPCEVIDIDTDISKLRANKRSQELPPTPVSADSTMYLPYSSGTTGKPKGVMLSHFNLVSNVLQSHHCELQFFKETDVTLSPLPMFHIYGFLASVHNPLVDGTTMVTMKRFDLERFCQLVEEYKVTRAHVVPPILLALAKSPVVAKYDMSSLEIAISAAAPLGKDLEDAVKKRLNCSVKQLWGMSELSPLGTGNHDNLTKSGTAGPPVASTSIKVIDIATGKSLGPNKEGHLLIRGPQVMQGYLNAPDKTAECLSEDGWLETGDIAIIDEHGFVKITDRMKELIKYKGFQIAPAELEDYLLTLPSVLDACVIGVPDEEAGELPRAYVVLHPEFQGKVTDQDIIEQMAEKVSKHKRLSGGVIFIDKIPKTESGKLLRRKVIEMDRAANPTN